LLLAITVTSALQNHIDIHSSIMLIAGTVDVNVIPTSTVPGIGNWHSCLTVI